MGKPVRGTKLIRGSYRRPHTKQERTRWENALEQGVTPRRSRSPANLPTSYDDIRIDRSKGIPYTHYGDRIRFPSWKSRSKARKQWERKGNIVFVGYPQHEGRWYNYDWKRVNLEKAD